jgi:hypothetical protein
MLIKRRGHGAYRGTSQIDLGSPVVEWVGETMLIKLSSTGVGDFSTNSRHDYDVFVSLDELGRMLTVTGNNFPRAGVSKAE